MRRVLNSGAYLKTAAKSIETANEVVWLFALLESVKMWATLGTPRAAAPELVLAPRFGEESANIEDILVL